MTIPMPEPAMRIYAEGDIRTVTEWRDGARDLPDGDHDLITTTQAEAYADARVRDALELAAQTCENQVRATTTLDGESFYIALGQAARAIRALIPPQQ